MPAATVLTPQNRRSRKNIKDASHNDTSSSFRNPASHPTIAQLPTPASSVLTSSRSDGQRKRKPPLAFPRDPEDLLVGGLNGMHGMSEAGSDDDDDVDYHASSRSRAAKRPATARRPRPPPPFQLDLGSDRPHAASSRLDEPRCDHTHFDADRDVDGRSDMEISSDGSVTHRKSLRVQFRSQDSCIPSPKGFDAGGDGASFSSSLRGVFAEPSGLPRQWSRLTSQLAQAGSSTDASSAASQRRSKREAFGLDAFDFDDHEADDQLAASRRAELRATQRRAPLHGREDVFRDDRIGAAPSRRARPSRITSSSSSLSSSSLDLSNPSWGSMLSGPSPRIPSVRPMPLPRVSSNQGNGTPATLAALLGPAMAGVMAPSTAAAGGLGNVLGPGGAAGQGAVTLSLATARLLATQLLTARHQTLEEALFRAQAVLRAGWTPSVSALPALLRRPPGAAAVEADAAVVAATDRATLKVMRQSHRVGRGGLMALRAQYALPAAPEGPDSASADRTLASQLETLATRLQTAQSRWWQQWRTLTRQCEANQRRMARVLHQASAVIARESEASASTSASASTAPSATSSSSASRWSRRIETLQQQWDATVRAYEADTTRLSQGALRAKRAVMAGLGLA